MKPLCLALLTLTACGGAFTSAIPTTDASDEADPLEAAPVDDAPSHHDQHHHDAAPADAGAELSVGDDASLADVVTPVDSATPDVVTGSDSGGAPDTSVPDTGCAPPSFTTATCNLLTVSVPSQFCSYNTYSYSYSVLPTPAECQCASTYNCTCLGWYAGSICSFSSCTMWGSEPHVTCD